MRAVRLGRDGLVKLVHLDEPKAETRQVVIRVEAAGMCGSDRHMVRGDFPVFASSTLGHEFEGTVVALGLGTSLSLGDRVTVDPNISCMTCRFCRTGLVAHCSDRVALGSTRDGGFADFVAVPERQTYKLHGMVPAMFGARLCEPLSCCLRAMDHADVRPGYAVVVLGGGVIGQLLVQLAYLVGATTIVLVTRQRARRALAEGLGATVSVDPTVSDVVRGLLARMALPQGELMLPLKPLVWGAVWSKQ